MDFHWGLYGQSIEYEDFAGNLQNSNGKEDCVAFHPDRWYDVACWSPRKIMCEKPSSKLCYHQHFFREYTLVLFTSVKVISHTIEVSSSLVQ